MTQPRGVFIDGIALWTPALPGWAHARAAFAEHPLPAAPALAARPAPALLAANERRRASDGVLVALEVASQALATSGHAMGSIASVFTSAHGDLAITDALCRTLAADPLLLSPTRFHHSVHNAASGYWAIASGSHAASTALAAFDASFAAGLLEACGLCATENEPVLLVGYDTEACGALASTNTSRGLLGVALVLAPARSAASSWSLQWSLQDGAAAPPPLHSAASRALAPNAMADALPLFEALASGDADTLEMRAGDALRLALSLQPLAHATTRIEGLPTPPAAA